MKPLCAVSAALLLLAGCGASPGGWIKPGAEAGEAAGAYQQCRALAGSSVKPEIGINEDILATRGNDWQRSQVGRVESGRMHEQTRDRAAAIVDSCMRAKGFARH